MTTPKRYEVRPGACDPRGRHWIYGNGWGSFSVSVGEVAAEGKRRPAAVYRISGPAHGDWPERVDAVAERIAAVMNGEEDPREVRFGPYRGYIHVVRTKSGKAAGLP